MEFSSILTIVGIIFAVAIGIGVLVGIIESNRVAKLPREEQLEYFNRRRYGEPNTEMICPHCQIKGRVYSRPLYRKNFLEMHVPQGITEAHCTNCNCTYKF